MLACAGSPTWNVSTGQEGKFKRDRKTCRQLTDGEEGQRDERFESCMKRRGWRHERFYDSWTVKW